MNIILDNNFNPHMFDQYTKAIIVGKGPTFQPISKPNKKTLLMGVNHAVDFLINPDILLCQDVEFFSDFTSLGSLKYVATPAIPHKGLVVNANGKDWSKQKIDHTTVADILSTAKFKGTYIPYINLNRHDGSYTSKVIGSSGPRAVQFVRAFMLNIKEIETYGIAAGESTDERDKYTGHHANFSNKSDSHPYSWGLRSGCRSTIQQVCVSGGIKLIMH
jgi:hypothetical protein